MKSLRDRIFGVLTAIVRQRRGGPRWTAVHVTELPGAPSLRTLYLIGDDGQSWFAALSCPCGCGEVIQLSLLPNDSPSWTFTRGRRGSPSLWPSVWRRQGCGSHFWLCDGRVIWAGLLDATPSRGRKNLRRLRQP